MAESYYQQVAALVEAGVFAVVVEHVAVDRTGRSSNDGLEVVRQGFPGLDVHVQLEGHVRLLPARGVVVLGRLV